MSTIEAAITNDAIGRIGQNVDSRLRRIMTTLLQHLHDFVREVELSEDEWRVAIDFLTRTGKMCGATRQEYILLSDVLGVSMLVDALNHPTNSGETESTVFGPFYAGEQAILPKGASILKQDESSEALVVQGRVLDWQGQPVANALIEVWQTASSGLYDVQDPEITAGHLRASFRTSDDGTYQFSTAMPVSYPIPADGPVGQLLDALERHPWRPAHIHFMISAPGLRRLVTHLFIAGDPYLESDAVFGVKPSLVVVPSRDTSDIRIEKDFVLAKQ